MPRPHAPRASQRAPKACLQCARRRVKCDKQIPCGTCLARGLEASCAREVVRVHGRLSSTRSEGPLPTHLKLQQENEQLKAELERLKAIPRHLPVHGGSLIPPALPTCSGRPLSTPEIFENQINLQHGETVYRHTVRDCSDIHLPTRECSNALLQHGFIWTSWIHFAIHTETFQMEHNVSWDSGSILESDYLWLAIYFGFIGMSLMFMTDNEAIEADIPTGADDLNPVSTSELVRNWYDSALYFLNKADFLRNHNMKAVQAIAILLGLGKSVGDFSSQPLLQATGIRIGQIIGMDREPPLISEDHIVQETSRRTWWTLIICEWLSIPPRSPCIQETDFEVKLPLNLSDRELLDSQSQHPPEHPRPVQYHLAMIAIAKSVYRFQYQLARLDKKDTESLGKLVLATDEDLANIISQLPLHLSEAPTTDSQAGEENSAYPPWVNWQWRTLSLSLLMFRMKINRFLQHIWLESSHTLLARSKVICLESAHALISLVNNQKDALARHRPWSMASSLFSAAMTLAIEAQGIPPHEAEENIQGIRLCLSFFAFLQDHNVLAARANTVLNEFIRDNNIL
ncbi:hypothetical protein BJX99DRAFT_222506 [Aspergillus californicus]